jgi:glycosyltransferase involved in cell wall biosynthesis
MSKTKLSFVIPAYNEEASIENTLDTLDEIVKNKKLQYEIVVVDDGSRDKTWSKASRYACKNGHVKVFRYPHNVGKGHAITTGFMNAQGEAVVFADSDRDIDLVAISCYIDALQHGDIVIGSKWHPDSVVSMSLARRILSHGFNVLVRFLTGSKIRDTQVGLKAMKREAFMEIFPRLAVKRYAFDVELLVVAHLYGLKVIEMPVCLELKAPFKLRAICRMLLDLLGIAYRLRVSHFYQQSVVPYSSVASS